MVKPTLLKKIKIRISKFNNFIASSTVTAMGTMACAYLFFMLSLTPLFFPSLLNIVQYVSGAILQLVSLPLIMVQGRISELRSQKDHIMIKQSFNEIIKIHKSHEENFNKLHEENNILKAELSEIKSMLNKTV